MLANAALSSACIVAAVALWACVTAAALNARAIPRSNGAGCGLARARTMARTTAHCERPCATCLDSRRRTRLCAHSRGGDALCVRAQLRGGCAEVLKPRYACAT
jgi:hypothetical protein